MNIEFHPLSVSDLNKAVSFYNKKGAGLGDKFRVEVYSAIERIRNNPWLYAEVSANKRLCRVHG